MAAATGCVLRSCSFSGQPDIILNFRFRDIFALPHKIEDGSAGSAEMRRYSPGNVISGLRVINWNMAVNEKEIFTSLFREAYEKGFSRPLTEALREPDAKRLSDEILEKTGLVIGWKSIKNFSLYATQPVTKKEENPSLATLDTLARYVQNAPVTDDLKRKTTTGQYPYWYDYKSNFTRKFPSKIKSDFRAQRIGITVAGLLIIALAVYFFSTRFQSENKNRFVEEFRSVSTDSLTKRGWILKKQNTNYWNRRNDVPGHLTLYTLLGDNWSDDNNASGITNLLTRKIDSDCFSTEIHLTNFLPYQNWQQAGILLSEDSTFNGNVLRLSIAYNNFFGGFTRPSEILIQVVGSNTPAAISKPEEIAHMVLFSGDPQRDTLIRNNLSKSALKIEKRGNHYRFLFTNGKMESFAFKEAAHRDFDIHPKYVAIFAMQGLAESENPIPASFDSFNIIDIDCND
jgi:hypothetical protein